MTKKLKNTSWEGAGADADNGEWETLPTGFAPLWKPKEGDTIQFTPKSVAAFKGKGAVGKKGKGKINASCTAVLRGGKSIFTTGGAKNQKEVSVKVGEDISVGLSFNMIGEDAIAVLEGNEYVLSPMSELLKKEGKSFRVRFDGKVPIGGGRSVNRYTIQVPNGFREKVLKSK